MALLASVNYDPAVAVNKVTTSLLAMTAIDTTNLRLTFTAPANGAVLVRLKGTTHGASSSPVILLGVLSGSTVVARAAPIGGKYIVSATSREAVEAVFVVTGLSGSQTWDAAYAVQRLFAGTGLKYGGPDDTTTNNAYGGFLFEVWETKNLCASTTPSGAAAILYDPATAVSKVGTSLLAMTAFDTTNLRLVFTAPASGNVLIRMRCPTTGATTGSYLMGVLEGATVIGRVSPLGGVAQLAAVAATDNWVWDAQFVATGVSAGSHTYDAAYGVEVVSTAAGFAYGGPNDAAGGDAWGGFAFEAWSA